MEALESYVEGFPYKFKNKDKALVMSREESLDLEIENMNKIIVTQGHEGKPLFKDGFLKRYKDLLENIASGDSNQIKKTCEKRLSDKFIDCMEEIADNKDLNLQALQIDNPDACRV